MSRKVANGLNQRQLEFCRQYVVDMSGADAVRRSGYSSRSPHHAAQHANILLRNPLIKAEIDRLIEEKKERTWLDVEFVLNGLKETLDKCLGNKKVKKSITVEDREVELEGYEFNPAGAVRTLELLGKHLKMFQDQLLVKTEETHDEAVTRLRDLLSQHNSVTTH